MWPHLKILHFLWKSHKIAKLLHVLVILVISLIFNENAASRGQAAQIVVVPMVFQWFREAGFQRKSWKTWNFLKFRWFSWNSMKINSFIDFREKCCISAENHLKLLNYCNYWWFLVIFLIFNEKCSPPRPGRPDRCVSYGISMVSGGKFSKKIMKTWNFLKFWWFSWNSMKINIFIDFRGNGPPKTFDFVQ